MFGRSATQIGTFALLLLACSKQASSEQASATSASPTASSPAPAISSAATSTIPPADSSYAQALEGHEQWRPGSICPIRMATLPAPKPGENLGEAALAMGKQPNQINTSIVKSFAQGKPPSPTGDDVPVLYVETSRTEPSLNPGTDTFQAGSSAGTAYIWDRNLKRYRCMAEIRVTNSPSVTSLRRDDRNARMWLTMDLQIAIDREIALNAKVIASGDGSDAGAADAGKRDPGKKSKQPDLGF